MKKILLTICLLIGLSVNAQAVGPVGPVQPYGTTIYNPPMTIWGTNGTFIQFDGNTIYDYNNNDIYFVY